MGVGYYVHHVGRGHLQRARSLAGRLPSLTALSSLPRPEDWPGEWVELARDDDGSPVHPTANGRLHWAPSGHPGLRSRMAAVSAWIERARPDVVVVDLSVEVLALVRLHGVPTVGVVLPGVRDDAAHRLGLDLADALVAFWPPRAHGMLRGAGPDVAARLTCLGALSRFAVDDGGTRPPRAGRSALLMLGAGGHDDADRVVTATPDWDWTVLDGAPGRWVEDPSAALRGADVVVTHAGQNALAEVAAARRPAVVVPQRRPHDEQATTGAVLRDGGWPAVVLDDWPEAAAAGRALERAAALDGAGWADWCDGRAVDRLLDVVRATAAGGRA